MQTLCLRRSPLWNRAVGFTPTRVICIDVLHSLYLGTLHKFSREALWFMFEIGCWGRCSSVETYKTAVFSLRSCLFNWYKTPRGEGLTCLHDLTTKMLGSFGDHKLKSKAMETWGVLLFLCDMLRQHRPLCGQRGAVFLEAGMLLQHYVDLIKAGGYNLEPAALQDHEIIFRLGDRKLLTW